VALLFAYNYIYYVIMLLPRFRNCIIHIYLKSYDRYELQKVITVVINCNFLYYLKI